LHLPVFDQPLVLFARSFWAIADTICAGAAIAIFRWKKWGFWLFSSMVLIQTILNLLMDSNWIITLLGVPMLYGVLHIGGDKKGWTQLE